MTSTLHHNWQLECRDLAKGYGATTVLRGVSITAKPGDILALLGPSGCGKTTTLRLIAGFESPDAGSIYIGGRLVAGESARIPAEERRVGMVFQEYALFPHLSVEDNVAFGLSGNRREKSARAAHMLALVGLGDFGTRMPHELSGGQQQRVALARALAPQPEILLLDEPFSNLDAALRAQVRAEVRAILKQSGTTGVLVTHDQHEALSFADVVAVMMRGRVAQMDDPQTLYQRPVSREIAAFVGEANFIAGEAEGDAVKCALGRLKLDEPQSGVVDVLIRPEAVRITEIVDHHLPARVIWREYYGHDQRVGLKLEDAAGTTLIARAGAWQNLIEGQRIGVWAAPPVRAFPVS